MMLDKAQDGIVELLEAAGFCDVIGDTLGPSCLAEMGLSEF